MRLLRRVESRMESAAGVGRLSSPPEKTRGAESGKKSKLHVQPAELARKLVKEMEDHKISRSGGVSVCNHYTVYLCRDDYTRLATREDEIVAKLQLHLSKHIRTRRYEAAGDIIVAMVVDPDLRLGRFGILADRAGHGLAKRLPPAPPVVARAGDGVEAARGTTQVIPRSEAAQLGLAKHTLILKDGKNAREFDQGRVIVGRARDVDFRVDDPNVSRRHVAIYWADGQIVVEDLNSTNGTMVNGYPVASTILRPNDVVVVGDCRITVETR